MLWTVITAVALAIVRLFFELIEEDVPWADDRILGLMLVFYTAVWGGAVVVTGLGFTWRSKWLAFFDQPGQWLALEISIRPVLAVTAIFVSPILCLGIGIVLNVYMAVMQPARSPWRVLFVLKAAVFPFWMFVVISLMFEFYSQLFSVLWFFLVFFSSYALIIILQLAGIRSEFRLGLRRHWTHWYGLLSHLASNLVTAGLILATALLN
jgi:hypothetical protein